MRTALLAFVALAVAGCASYRPIVDSHSISSRSQYETDLRDCQRYAREVRPAESVAASAIVGALVGAAVAVALGGDHYAVDHFAAYGAIEGAAEGGTAAGATQVDIIRDCMSERGYVVLQ